MLLRLAALGASEDQLEAVQAGWGQFDEDYTPEVEHRLANLTDARLRALIRQSADEYTAGTSDTPEADQEVDERAYAALVAEARDRIGQSVPALLEWVGSSPQRAQAVLDMEAEAGKDRATLVGPLQSMVG